jgi:hypothetical protein
MLGPGFRPRPQKMHEESTKMITPIATGNLIPNPPAAPPRGPAPLAPEASDSVQLSRVAGQADILRGAAGGALLLGAPAALGAALGPYGVAAGLALDGLLGTLACRQSPRLGVDVAISAGFGLVCGLAGSLGGFPGAAAATAVGVVLGAYASACSA